ncbi:MAG TPA: 16S rRNA (cytosine(1402)-N(4))-methyltransferase RsmH [Candidatus Babeliales bacterium]|jgi:16S rRNA (cytosine1402-N4)-methyltransferase|nr:16S rRNA (cytosine(1402)-N(4))-methyltransferase RsmH [Candidatus Babeliales bacterium]
MASITDNKESRGHTAVLVQEVVDYLITKPGGMYLDVTFGAGGHTQAILEKDKTCRVIALDWDMRTLDTYGPPLKELYGERLCLLWGNFAQLYAIVKKEHIPKMHGILADFGTSQMQLFERAGFSFSIDTPLDMRMSPAHQLVTAAQVVNSSSEEKLKQIFWQLGQERFSGLIARAIVQRRQEKKFSMTNDLAKVVASAIPIKGNKRLHPATKVFQALRIYVNHELENIRSFLAEATRLLLPGGRLVCISFHSLEDGLVKDFYKNRELEGIGHIITKKVIVPSQKEVDQNPSSRSAKMRVFEFSNFNNQ